MVSIFSYMYPIRSVKKKGLGHIRDTIKPSLRKQSSLNLDHESTDKSEQKQAPVGEFKSIPGEKAVRYKINSRLGLKWQHIISYVD